MRPEIPPLDPQTFTLHLNLEALLAAWVGVEICVFCFIRWLIKNK